MSDNKRMRGIFIGVTTLDVAQLVAEPVVENQKVTSLDQLICAGGPATNAAVTFSALERSRLAGGVAADFISEGGVKSLQCEAGGAHWGEDVVTAQAVKTCLYSAFGRGSAAALLRADLEQFSINTIDCTDYSGSEVDSFTPAVSGIFVNAENGSRTLASTNSRLPLSAETAVTHISECQDEVSVMLIDGHNHQLAQAILPLDLNEKYGASKFVTEGSLLADDPFAVVERKPSYLRILDGGSWKPWLPGLLPYVDVAVLSADFKAPLAADLQDTIDFLNGFGITKIVRTAGEQAVEYWWDGERGTVPVPTVKTVCTLGAGDIFHGAFAWGCVQLRRVHALAEQNQPQQNLSAAEARCVIKFAAKIAALSVTKFGTRGWLADLF